MKTETLDHVEGYSFTNSKHVRPRRNGWAGSTAWLCLTSLLTTCALTALAGSANVGGKKNLKVYQANAYVGGLISAPLALDPSDPNYVMELLQSVTEVYQQIIAADPAARLAALAEEIAAQRPDVAGLEELYTVEAAPDTDHGPSEFAVVFDYLQLLTNALAAKREHYEVAVLTTESDIAMPMIASLQPFALAWGRIIDHEAILVRSDLPPGHLRASNPQTGRFTIYPQLSLGGETISLYRGWCSIDVFMRGERVRVVCTHLNDESVPEIQKAEELELLAGLAELSVPVVVIGDLNTDPLGRNGTDSYPAIVAAGFEDTWADLNPQDVAGGLTWGHDAGLVDPTTPFAWRLDYVLYRGGLTPTGFEILDPSISASAPPLWPSDHAAVTATFLFGDPVSSKGELGHQAR